MRCGWTELPRGQANAGTSQMLGACGRGGRGADRAARRAELVERQAFGGHAVARRCFHTPFGRAGAKGRGGRFDQAREVQNGASRRRPVGQDARGYGLRFGPSEHIRQAIGADRLPGDARIAAALANETRLLVGHGWGGLDGQGEPERENPAIDHSGAPFRPRSYSAVTDRMLQPSIPSNLPRTTRSP